jgi:hypothetical protein
VEGGDVIWRQRDEWRKKKDDKWQMGDKRRTEGINGGRKMVGGVRRG